MLNIRHLEKQIKRNTAVFRYLVDINVTYKENGIKTGSV